MMRGAHGRIVNAVRRVRLCIHTFPEEDRVKVPLLSRSEGGGGGLLARALGTVALATVFAVSVGAGLATAAEQPAGPSGPAASASAKPILKVTVIGDSFTSGEGASSST